MEFEIKVKALDLNTGNKASKVMNVIAANIKAAYIIKEGILNSFGFKEHFLILESTVNKVK